MSAFDLSLFLKQLPERPGVYQMFDARGEVIYVGKAKNLKRRVRSYFQKRHDSLKTQKLVERIARIEVTLTETEAEALLLESTLIKRLNPRYNVLFRDDKSYPYIYVDTAHEWPGVYFHRGARKRPGRYFGPFPDAGAVYETLHTLQKIFPVRQCEEGVFRNRSRPCLAYQIGRCSAPCVGKVSAEVYAQDVEHTLMFLEGRSHAVIERLGERMEQAASELAFEKAAQLRDRISALRSVQNQLLIRQQEMLDVIGLVRRQGQFAIELMRYQGGTLWGARHFFPKGADLTEEEVLEAFVTQHYAEAEQRPACVLLADGWRSLAKRLQKWSLPVRAARSRTDRELVHLAETNALEALRQHLQQRTTQREKMMRLQSILSLPRLPRVMECFDISHTQGAETVASCVCFVDGLPEKRRYRRFNIRSATAGDDYAALAEAVARHYARLRAQPEQLPELLVIDGGKGQLNRVMDVLSDLELTHVLPVIGVAKGEGRKVGLEVLYTPDAPEGIDLPPDDPALHLINFLRDEAHRFALAGHRARRRKRQLKSVLEEIPGVGPKTRQKLLKHFGGLQALKQAPASELEKVPGVSRKLARRIHAHFQGEIE